MHLLKFILINTLSFLFLFSCSESGKTEKITIATAANMQFAMKKLAQDFEENTHIKCNLIIGSSGQLTAQIKEGAPYDVFVAANTKYPNEVYQSGLGWEKPKTYALGQLVLWSMLPELEPSVDLLQSDDVKHIALANPKTAPYGVAAKQVLQHFKLNKKLENKLVYGESIAQTNQFITSKSAQVGFTAKSVVLSPQMKNKGKWIEIEQNAYSPIQQAIVLIKNDNLKNSKAFYNYLSSSDAQLILEDYGYSVNNK